MVISHHNHAMLYMYATNYVVGTVLTLITRTAKIIINIVIRCLVYRK